MEGEEVTYSYKTKAKIIGFVSLAILVLLLLPLIIYDVYSRFTNPEYDKIWNWVLLVVVIVAVIFFFTAHVLFLKSVLDQVVDLKVALSRAKLLMGALESYIVGFTINIFRRLLISSKEFPTVPMIITGVLGLIAVLYFAFIYILLKYTREIKEAIKSDEDNAEGAVLPTGEQEQTE